MVDVAEIKIWDTLVGAVRWDDSQQLGYFQFDYGFPEKDLDLSPIKMPVAQGSRIYSFPELRKGRVLDTMW